MKTNLYPFSFREQEYPEGSYIIKNSNEEKSALIEYDLERLKAVFHNDDPMEFFNDFSFAKDLTTEQIKTLLQAITNNIVMIQIKDN